MRVLLLSMIFLCALAVRAPDLWPPRFWAEDASTFLSDQLRFGWQAFFFPYAGYLHAVPRLSMMLIDLFPLSWAASLSMIIVVAMTAWSASIIIRVCGAGAGGAIAAIALVLASGWTEPVGSVTNLQWVIAPGLLALILKTSAIGRAEGLVFAFLASLSGPFAAAFAPLTAIVVTTQFYRYRSINWVAIIAGISGLVQVLVIVLSPESTGSQKAEPVWLFARLLALPFGYSPLPLVAALLLVATLFVGESRWLRAGLVSGVLLLTAIVCVKFNHLPRIFEAGTVGQRYWYVQGVLWVMVAASALSDVSKIGKALAVGGLLLTFLQVNKEPLRREWPWPTQSWSGFVSEAQMSPATHHYAPGWNFDLDLSGSKK